MGIPQEEPPPPRAHIDTDILRAALDPADATGLHGPARSLIFNRAEAHRVCVSAPVLAELLLTITRDTIEEGGPGFRNFEGIIGRFWSWTHDDKLEFYMFGDDPDEVFRIGHELRQVDHQMSATDVVVLACFLSDTHAALFFTTDGELLVNLPVFEFVSETWEGKSIRPLGD